MGNSNSGNHGGKRTTDQLYALDVRKLLRAEKINAESFGAEGAVVTYRGIEQTLRLTWTACHYGGKRAWWLCPVPGCGRRVAVLYAGRALACRHCHRLAYKSQRETANSRAYRRANKLREALGWVPGVIHGPGDKPKGMHWRTFWRMHAAQDAATMEALGGGNERVEKLLASLERMSAAMRRRA